jgi:alanyl-tRNA synthetase
MNYFEIKKNFLEFFEKRGHKIIPSSSLIPQNDPSVLLTTAGMQQFKEYFLRKKIPEQDFGTQRVTSCQKCFRTTDIEEVGDERHLTFFEMLGNFSFGPVKNDDPSDFSTGGYFKRASIYWAFEFLTQHMNLKIEYVTYFGGDSEIPEDLESFNILKELNLPIKSSGREDNFWGPTGNEGPCGPTVEFYINGLEVWNLVFNEYYKYPDGSLKKLEFPGVDTGMGYERLLMVLEKKENVFETSAFDTIYKILKPFIPQEYINFKRDQRIILDHLRAIVFLISDGVLPSNILRGYVLRRILRRLFLKLKQLNVPKKSYNILIQKTCEFYSKSWPEVENYKKVIEVFEEELDKFNLILERGIRLFNKNIDDFKNKEKRAKKAFDLFSTYGFPLELTKELLRSNDILWEKEDEDEFLKLFEEHKKISKKLFDDEVE